MIIIINHHVSQISSSATEHYSDANTLNIISIILLQRQDLYSYCLTSFRVLPNRARVRSRIYQLKITYLLASVASDILQRFTGNIANQHQVDILTAKIWSYELSFSSIFSASMIPSSRSLMRFSTWSSDPMILWMLAYS